MIYGLDKKFYFPKVGNGGIMCVQGRAKWIEKQMSSLLEQMLSYPFGERSDRGNAKHFLGSARR